MEVKENDIYWLSDFGKEWFLEPTERTKKKKALKESTKNGKRNVK